MIENENLKLINSIPLLSFDDDRKLMLHYMHDLGIIAAYRLRAMHIRRTTLKRYWKAERAKYIFKATPITDKPIKKLPGRKPKYLRYSIEKHDTTLSRELLDCRESVLTFYLNRNKTSQGAPGREIFQT